MTLSSPGGHLDTQYRPEGAFDLARFRRYSQQHEWRGPGCLVRQTTFRATHHNEHGERRMVGPQLLEELRPGYHRHLQIEEDQVLWPIIL
jgi:hypothetical protein